MPSGRGDQDAALSVGRGCLRSGHQREREDRQCGPCAPRRCGDARALHGLSPWSRAIRAPGARRPARAGEPPRGLARPLEQRDEENRPPAGRGKLERAEAQARQREKDQQEAEREARWSFPPTTRRRRIQSRRRGPAGPGRCLRPGRASRRVRAAARTPAAQLAVVAQRGSIGTAASAAATGPARRRRRAETPRRARASRSGTAVVGAGGDRRAHGRSARDDGPDGPITGGVVAATAVSVTGRVTGATTPRRRVGHRLGRGGERVGGGPGDRRHHGAGRVGHRLDRGGEHVGAGLTAAAWRARRRSRSRAWRS